MVKIAFPKSKRSIIFSLLIIISLLFIGAGIFLRMYDSPKDQKPSDSNTQKSSPNQEDENSPTPKDGPEQLTPPDAKLPDVCGKITPAVDQAIGAGAQSTGNNSTTQDNLKLTECNFSKDQKLVNIKIYEYSGESEAASDLEKRQIKGYSTKNKGKYNVLVSVSSGNGVDTAKSNSVLDFILGQL